jgi:hypothetical protein
MATELGKVIPDDFPRQGQLGTVSGVQPKLPARRIVGRFVAGLTSEELYVRYDNCFDLVEQLTAYTRGKLAAMPNAKPGDLLARMRRGAECKGWDVSSGEMDWIFSKVAGRLGIDVADVADVATVPQRTSLEVHDVEVPHVETLVQRALRGSSG